MTSTSTIKADSDDRRDGSRGQDTPRPVHRAAAVVANRAREGSFRQKRKDSPIEPMCDQ
jgi:hypothetical protein